MKDLTAGDRKVLLVFDGYRSHLGFQVLETLDQGNVIALALPAHTSGVTQPLDVGVFPKFKARLNDLIPQTSRTDQAVEYDVFDFCRMMSAVYREIFEPTNILAGFRKADVWPVNPDAIINAGMPLNGESSRTLCSVEDLSNMIKMKRQKLADGIGRKRSR